MKKDELNLSGSDVLYYELEDGTCFIIRPSGTEPKIKIYVLACGKSRAEAESAALSYVSDTSQTLRM